MNSSFNNQTYPQKTKMTQQSKGISLNKSQVNWKLISQCYNCLKNTKNMHLNETKPSNSIPNNDSKLTNNKKKEINLFTFSNCCQTMDSKISMHKRQKRNLFSKEEDNKIIQLTQIYGTKNWAHISSFIEGRSAKQCRDRYSNYLVPSYSISEWSKEEDDLLSKLYEELGPKWFIIKKSFPNRGPNTIKNRWKFFLCRQKNENTTKYTNEKQIDQKGNNKKFQEPDYNCSNCKNSLDNESNILFYLYFFNIKSTILDLDYSSSSNFWETPI